ncbi:segregation and condensation protein A [Mycoplasma putrefaciens]|uniref:Segregation and condensation protein A n=1 Tax=Mycoplasma putrefaciens (strain ATCC 15718 / NCTC 10155 / C30 KS-1 / KS-1) TaxID=743965 RepID=A0A7U3ZSL7_MYCPK|nr:segregation/condensation protein A [Mycoplasma putrefaciens]AEM68765.1 Segregation and condensation protein A [Mycoplasma putrefaciens KS1]
MKHWTEVTIDQFSGPIELLWTMIKEKKISIVKLSLIEILDQYLEYIRQNQELDIEIASEYLTIAAQLIELKSRYLLPVVEVESATDELEFDELVNRIEQYDQIKNMANFFVESQNLYFTTLSKKKSKQNFSKELAFNSEEVLLDPLDIDLDKFTEIFRSVISKSKINDYYDDFDFENEIYQTLTTQAISPQQIANEIIAKMKTSRVKVWTLYELLEGMNLNNKNLISCFLAVLDLVRYQIMTISEHENDILIGFRKEVVQDESIIIKQLQAWESEVQYEQH